MIETNTEVFEFVDGNWIAITIALGLLSGVVKLTKWKWDDGFVALLKGLFSDIRGKKREPGS